MNITYQISKSDYLNAAQLARRTRAKFTSYLLYLFPILAIYFGWMGLRTAINLQDFSGLWSLAFACLILFLFPLFPNLMWRFQFRKNPLLKAVWGLDVNDDGVHSIGPNIDSRTTWQNYAAFAENNVSFVLHQRGTPIALPIPKRGLSPSQIEELRAFFETHLPRK